MNEQVEYIRQMLNCIGWKGQTRNLGNTNQHLFNLPIGQAETLTKVATDVDVSEGNPCSLIQDAP